MTKRIIGLVLALCLVVGLLPMIALAEETEKTASLTILTGTADNKKSWKPTLSEGMAPAYGTNDADGNVSAGTAANWTIKVEWAVGGNPTLTLNNATIINELRETSYHTVTLGGNVDWDVLLKGTNTILGNPTGSSTAYRGGQSIRCTTTGLLTIKGESKADTLNIENVIGHCIARVYGPMVIDTATVTLSLKQTSNAHSCILLQYGTAGLEDVTNLTIRNADVTFSGIHYVNRAIVMYGTSSSYDSTNTGDILFQNSKITMNRSGSYGWQTADKTAFIWNTANSTFTIDRCDVTMNAGAFLFTYAPLRYQLRHHRAGWLQGRQV